MHLDGNMKILERRFQMNKELEDWQKRVVEEKDELGIKVNKLTNYLAKDDNHEKHLLWIQLKVMRSYLEILKVRIKEFKNGKNN